MLHKYSCQEHLMGSRDVPGPVQAGQQWGAVTCGDRWNTEGASGSLHTPLPQRSSGVTSAALRQTLGPCRCGVPGAVPNTKHTREGAAAAVVTLCCRRVCGGIDRLMAEEQNRGACWSRAGPTGGWPGARGSAQTGAAQGPHWPRNSSRAHATAAHGELPDGGAGGVRRGALGVLI